MKRLYCVVYVDFSVSASSCLQKRSGLGKIVIKDDNSFSGVEERISQRKIYESSAQNIAEALSNSSPHLIIRSESNGKARLNYVVSTRGKSLLCLTVFQFMSLIQGRLI